MALLNLSLTSGTNWPRGWGSPDFRQIYLVTGMVQVGFLLLIRWIDVSETRRVLGEQAPNASPLSPAAE